MSEQRTGSNGGKYLDMTLADRTGEMNGKLWDGNVLPPPTGSVIKVRGLTLEYNGRLQLRIEKLRALEPGDEVDMSALTPSAPESPEVMLEELDAAIESLNSEPLRKIVAGLVARYREQLSFYPAAQRIHHVHHQVKTVVQRVIHRSAKRLPKPFVAFVAHHHSARGQREGGGIVGAAVIHDQ